MFERLERPFLTVETGEAYGPARLEYEIIDNPGLIGIISQLKCCEKTSANNTWHWFWQDECDHIHFESIEGFQRNPARPIRLGTLVIREQKLYIQLPSFKRACLAVSFFQRTFAPEIAKISKADFINKIFSLNERLPHGFTELFKEEELDRIVRERIEHYEQIQEKIENAATAEEAFGILADYTKAESHKRLPYAERYDFNVTDTEDPDVLYLSFYIFLRSRELVALRRWVGEPHANLAETVDETIRQVFGDVDIDIID